MADSSEPSNIIEQHNRVRHRAALISLLVGFGMLVIKVGAYLVTMSAVVLSDAVESVVHVVATLVVYMSMRIALIPRDQGHPYGHGRIEQFSVGFEGGLVALAGIGIFAMGVDRILNPHEPQNLHIGLIAVGLAAAVNMVLGTWLVRTGKRVNSPILVADGKHVLTDVWTSVAVFGGILIVFITGEAILDAVFAMAVALYVIYEAWHLIAESWNKFLDKADPELLGRIIEIINEHRSPEWIEIHGLRSRANGGEVHIDMHLVVPANWSVVKAHEEVERLEQVLLSGLETQGSVFVHLDHPDSSIGDDELKAIYPNWGEPFSVEAATRLAKDVDLV